MDNKDPLKKEPKGKTMFGVVLVLFMAVAAVASAVTMDKRNKSKDNQRVELVKDVSNKPVSGNTSQETTKTDSKDVNANENITTKSDNQNQEEKPNSLQAAIDTANLSFDANTKLVWPVEGQILIPYSMDTTTYFRTLNEYKCNDSIFIQADENMQVKAAVKGVVTKTSSNEEVGNYVTMDIGGGYTLTYGMLNPTKFDIGQVIEKGEVLGTVANPTRYYTTEGYSLYLRLAKDGLGVDPLDYLNYEDNAADNIYDGED